MNSLHRFADPVYCIMRLIVGLLFFYGPGRFSVDAMMMGGSASTPSTT
jgi:hypothetical protein